MTVFATAELDHPIERVWALVGDFAGLRRWHPIIDRCGISGKGIGAVRTIHFADWWAAERLAQRDPMDHVVSYEITDSSRPEVIGVVGTIRLTALPGDRTRVEWTSGHQPDHHHAAAVNPGLEAYYPTRIGHLRDALAQGW